MYRAGLPAMRGRFRRRWIGLLAALLLLWTGTARAQDALVGQLLIASPQMTQAVFTHTVILIVQHTDQGALGIVINQPFEQKTIASLLADIGKKDDSVQGSIDVFAGGPMEPGVGFIVHSIDYHRAETQPIDSHIALTASTEVLRDMGHGKGPKKSLVAFGYAGWGPGQLEVELARHDWITIPEDPDLLFDDDRKKVWDDAMARRGQPL
jgi:putative transcriptional regulator